MDRNQLLTFYSQTHIETDNNWKRREFTDFISRILVSEVEGTITEKDRQIITRLRSLFTWDEKYFMNFRRTVDIYLDYTPDAHLEIDSVEELKDAYESDDKSDYEWSDEIESIDMNTDDIEWSAENEERYFKNIDIKVKNVVLVDPNTVIPPSLPISEVKPISEMTEIWNKVIKSLTQKEYEILLQTDEFYWKQLQPNFFNAKVRKVLFPKKEVV